MDEGTDGMTPAPALRERHRVTTKGTRVPASTETFSEMEERYQMPKGLRKNLEGCGYEIPTSIQSVGVPIVLEVRLCPSFGQEKG
jgi:superfamily II DNA/RNA helicase